MNAPTNRIAGDAPPRPRHALVTGGAGFIGSHLTDLLLARGDRVTIVDNLSTGRTGNLPPTHPSLRLIDADLSEAIPSLGREGPFDEVYHLAAAVGVQLVMDDPIRAVQTNVVQTLDLLRFAASSETGGGAPVPTLLASSSEVYGKGSRSPFSEDDDVVYGPTGIARWSYGCSKAIDEFLALAHHRQHGLPVVVARFFNTVGPRQVGSYGMVLPRFVQAAVQGKPIRVFGDGTQTRCFCDVRDVVRALPAMLETPACHGRVFNLGSDREISIRELAETVVRVLGSASPIVLVPYAEAYPEGFEDLERRRPDLRRIRDAIGFEPRIGLEQTITDVAEAISGTRREGARA